MTFTESVLRLKGSGDAVLYLGYPASYLPAGFLLSQFVVWLEWRTLSSYSLNCLIYFYWILVIPFWLPWLLRFSAFSIPVILVTDYTPGCPSYWPPRAGYPSVTLVAG